MSIKNWCFARWCFFWLLVPVQGPNEKTNSQVSKTAMSWKSWGYIFKGLLLMDEMVRRFRFSPEYWNKIKLYSTQGFAGTGGDVKCSSFEESEKEGNKKHEKSNESAACNVQTLLNHAFVDWSFEPGIVLENNQRNHSLTSSWFYIMPTKLFGIIQSPNRTSREAGSE